MSRKKITWIAPIIIFLLMLIMGLTYSDNSDANKLLVMLNFNMNEWINLVLVLVGSTLFTMEYQNNTILTLLYKSPSKIYVYLSKFIIIFLYDFILHIFALVLTILFNWILPNFHFNLFEVFKYNQSLLANLATTSIVDLFTTLFIISLIFLTSCIINEGSVVIAINLGIVFMGQATSNQILNFYHHFINIVKWNPANMLNLTYQYANYDMYHKLTKLGNLQMISATSIYIFTMFLVGYTIFRKKRF